MELAVGAVGVDPVAVDHRAAAGAVVVAVTVAVACRVAEGPIALSGFGVQAVDDFLLALAVEVHQPGIVDGRGGVTGSLGQFPDQGRPAVGPILEQAGLGGNPVVCRAQEGGPIVGDRSAGQRLGLGVEANAGVGSR